MLVTEMAITVTNILKLSPEHSVTNIDEVESESYIVVGEGCWIRIMLDKNQMLLTDLIHWKSHQHEKDVQEFCHQYFKSVTIVKS